MESRPVSLLLSPEDGWRPPWLHLLPARLVVLAQCPVAVRVLAILAVDANELERTEARLADTGFEVARHAKFCARCQGWYARDNLAMLECRECALEAHEHAAVCSRFDGVR